MSELVLGLMLCVECRLFLGVHRCWWFCCCSWKNIRMNAYELSTGIKICIHKWVFYLNLYAWTVEAIHFHRLGFPISQIFCIWIHILRVPEVLSFRRPNRESGGYRFHFQRLPSCGVHRTCASRLRAPNFYIFEPASSTYSYSGWITRSYDYHPRAAIFTHKHQEMFMGMNKEPSLHHRQW